MAAGANTRVNCVQDGVSLPWLALVHEKRDNLAGPPAETHPPTCDRGPRSCPYRWFGGSCGTRFAPVHLPNFKQSILLFLFIQHGFQLLLALIAIAVLKFWLAPADYGLYWPRGKSYILPALLWGLGLAIAVNAGNSWLDSLLHVSQATSDITYTHRTVWGWATFEGLYVGPTEEIPFRALLVT